MLFDFYSSISFTSRSAVSRFQNAAKREAGQEALSKILTKYEFYLVTCAKDVKRKLKEKHPVEGCF